MLACGGDTESMAELRRRSAGDVPGSYYYAKRNDNPYFQYDLTAVIGEDGAEWAKWAQDRTRIQRRNPRLAALVGPMPTLRVRDIVHLESLGSGPRGGYTRRERSALPAAMFLKPSTRSWPVADSAHAVIALQYMTRGLGRRWEYPYLVRRLAKLWPVTNENRDIWAFYAENMHKIQEKAGTIMPSVDDLAGVRRNPVGVVLTAIGTAVIPILAKMLEAKWEKLLSLSIEGRVGALDKIAGNAILIVSPGLGLAWKTVMPKKMKGRILLQIARSMDDSNAQELAKQLGQAAVEAAQQKVGAAK
jgi:hypothetical protein